MAVGRKSSAVVDKGGNVLINQILNTTNTITTVSASYTFDLGMVGSSDVNQTTSVETFKSEDGEIQSTSYDYDRRTTAVLMQSDKDLVDYLGDTVKSKSILEIKYLGYRAGKHCWFFKVGNVTPQFSVKSPGGTASMNYEHVGIDVSSALTFTSTDLASISTLLSLSNFPTTAVTISASKSFEYVEV